MRFSSCIWRNICGRVKGISLWGHCDLDQYFGTINHFVTEEVLNTYDKILCLGHFTLFRNTPYINALYKIPDKNSGQGYRDAFSDGAHWIFDEWPTNAHTSSNRIFKQEGVKTWLCPQCFCDLQPFQSHFRRTLFDYSTESWTDDPVKNEIYLWKNGKLMRCFEENGQLRQQEILYVHIRQRKLTKVRYDQNDLEFLISPNCFTGARQFTDTDIMHALRKANQRAILFPDEIRRKYVLFCGLMKAGLRKLQSY